MAKVWLGSCFVQQAITRYGWRFSFIKNAKKKDCWDPQF